MNWSYGTRWLILFMAAFVFNITPLLKDWQEGIPLEAKHFEVVFVGTALIMAFFAVLAFIVKGITLLWRRFHSESN